MPCQTTEEKREEAHFDISVIATLTQMNRPDVRFGTLKKSYSKTSIDFAATVANAC